MIVISFVVMGMVLNSASNFKEFNIIDLFPLP